MIDTLHIDLTSYSKTFNSLSPQGQWFCNRIGKRKYPIQETNLNLLKEFISKNKPKKVFCNSFYGDSLEYSEIVELSKYCKELDIEFMVFTSGSNLDKNLIDKLLKNNTTFYLYSYGVEDNANKIVLGIDWIDIYNFLKQTKNKCIIEFSSYKHNIKDIYKMLKICKEYGCSIKITKGNNFKERVTNIFNAEGKWLYDVLPIEEDLPFEDLFLHDVTEAIKEYKDIDIDSIELYRSTEGYMNTRYFIKKDRGENIFDAGMPDLGHMYPLQFNYNDEVFINSTGHIFCDRESYDIFNNCLANDWNLKFMSHVSDNISRYRKSGKHHLHEQESEFVKNVLFKNIFYFKKNLQECILEKNIENFYWAKSS